MLRRRYYARASLAAALLFASLILLSTASLVATILHLAYSTAGEDAPPANGQMSGDLVIASSTIESITAQIKDVNNKISIVNNATPESTARKQSLIISQVVDALGMAVKATGRKATISSFRFSAVAEDAKTQTPAGYKISLSGVAEDRATLLAITKELGRTEGVAAVNNPISNYVPGKDLAFTIEVVVR